MNSIKKIITLIAITFLLYGILLAQNQQFVSYMIGDTRKMNNVIKKLPHVSASNNLPALNEQVEVNITYTPDFESQSKYDPLGFSLPDGCELISGDNFNKTDFRKGAPIMMRTIIKFTKEKVYDISIVVGMEFPIRITFYVGNAIRECDEVKDLRKEIKTYEKIIEGERKNEIPFQPHYTKHRILDTLDYDVELNPFNDYEKQNLEQIKIRNVKLYSKLKQVYDSLNDAESQLRSKEIFQKKNDNNSNKKYKPQESYPSSNKKKNLGLFSVPTQSAVERNYYNPNESQISFKFATMYPRQKTSGQAVV